MENLKVHLPENNCPNTNKRMSSAKTLKDIIKILTDAIREDCSQSVKFFSYKRFDGTSSLAEESEDFSQNTCTSFSAEKDCYLEADEEEYPLSIPYKKYTAEIGEINETRVANEDFYETVESFYPPKNKLLMLEPNKTAKSSTMCSMNISKNIANLE